MPEPKLKILIVDDQVPIPEVGFGFPRMNTIIDLLADSGFDVRLFPVFWIHGISRTSPCTVVDSSKTDLSSHLRQVSSPYDAILISRTRNFSRFAYTVRKYSPSSLLIFDVEALNSRRELLKAIYRRKNPSQEQYVEAEAQERRMLAAADLIVSVSNNEQSIINKWGFHNVIVIGHLHKIRIDSPGFDQRRDLLIVQGCHKVKNHGGANSVNWFLKNVLPLLSVEKIGRVTIAGHGMSEDRLHNKHRAHPGLNVVGEFPSVRDILDRHRILVVTSRVVAGLPWKVTESMAHGLPVVATTRIAELLEIGDAPCLLHDDDPERLSRKIEACYQDEVTWSLVRNNAYDYVRQFCSASVLERAVTEMRDRIKCH